LSISTGSIIDTKTNKGGSKEKGKLQSSGNGLDLLAGNQIEGWVDKRRARMTGKKNEFKVNKEQKASTPAATVTVAVQACKGRKEKVGTRLGVRSSVVSVLYTSSISLFSLCHWHHYPESYIQPESDTS
jgi:hypothetical protein